MSIPVELPKSSPWKVQFLVLQGLFIRECSTRFGKAKLGLFWALLQPLAIVIMLGLVFGFFLERTIPSIPYPMFLLAGFLPFNFFRGLITSSTTCFEANQGLLIHQKVRPTDPIFARVLYELMISIFAFWVFIIVATWFFDAAPNFLDPLPLVGAWAAITLMGTGLGIFFAILGWKQKGVQKVVPLLMRPLLFISCILYPLNIVPGSHRDFYLYNPLVHVIETMRKSLYPLYRTEEVTLVYPLIVGVIVFWLGMAYYRVNRGALYDFGR